MFAKKTHEYIQRSTLEVKFINFILGLRHLKGKLAKLKRHNDFHWSAD